MGYDIGLEFGKSEVFKGLNGGDLKAIRLCRAGQYIYVQAPGTYGLVPTLLLRPISVVITSNTLRPDKDPDVAAGNVVYVVRFVYAPGAEPELTPTEQVDAALKESGRERPRNFDYWFCGREELKPIAAFDDGVQTHITFSPRAEIPAVFLKNEDRH